MILKFKPNPVLASGINPARLSGVKRSLIVFFSIGGLLLPSFLFALIPSDTHYSNQWYLPKIQAEKAWNINTGSDDIIIAILDSGVDIDHPDLEENIWVNTDEIANDGIDNDRNGYVDDVNGWDFLENTNDPNPKFTLPYNIGGINHGTIIAGIAAAVGSNARGITGLSFHSKIMPLRVLNGVGSGNADDVVRAIDYAIAEGVDILNLSFVGLDKEQSRSLEEAIRRAWKAGLIIVAAAGNEGAGAPLDLDDHPLYPVCYDDGDNMVIGVVALDAHDRKTSFSNYGRKCVDISAPGVNFYSTQFYDPTRKDYWELYGGWWSGTSLATPLVSATAALLKSNQPSLSNAEIRDLILNTADSIATQNLDLQEELGRGRLNVYNAIRGRKNNSTLITKEKIVTGAGKGGGPHVRIFYKDGSLYSHFFAYDEKFRGGINVAIGDVNGDGKQEIVTGPGPGGGPHVRVFDQAGRLLSEFMAYHPDFKGGISVAVGDVNGDGIKEIITGAGKGGGPHVRIFNSGGDTLSEFMAFAEDFRGGIKAVSSDWDNDGKDDLIIVPNSELAPYVSVFDREGRLKFQFLAFPPDWQNGIDIAAAKLDGDSFPEFIVGAGQGRQAFVRLFSWQGKLKWHQMVYPEGFLGGVNVGAADLEGDGQKEIITGAGPGGGPHVRVFDVSGGLISQFFAYGRDFRGGVKVAP